MSLRNFSNCQRGKDRLEVYSFSGNDVDSENFPLKLSHAIKIISTSNPELLECKKRLDILLTLSNIALSIVGTVQYTVF